MTMLRNFDKINNLFFNKETIALAGVGVGIGFIFNGTLVKRMMSKLVTNDQIKLSRYDRFEDSIYKIINANMNLARELNDYVNEFLNLKEKNKNNYEYVSFNIYKVLSKEKLEVIDTFHKEFNDKEIITMMHAENLYIKQYLKSVHFFLDSTHKALVFFRNISESDNNVVSEESKLFLSISERYIRINHLLAKYNIDYLSYMMKCKLGQDVVIASCSVGNKFVVPDISKVKIWKDLNIFFEHAINSLMIGNMIMVVENSMFIFTNHEFVTATVKIPLCFLDGVNIDEMFYKLNQESSNSISISYRVEDSDLVVDIQGKCTKIVDAPFDNKQYIVEVFGTSNEVSSFIKMNTPAPELVPEELLLESLPVISRDERLIKAIASASRNKEYVDFFVYRFIEICSKYGKYL